MNEVKNVEKTVMTAFSPVSEITPMKDRLVVKIKTWPAQNTAGLLVPESTVLIRAEQYITEVVTVGSNVKMVEKGDIVIVSMFSGHHIKTKVGDEKIKMIYDTDILTFKKNTDMQKLASFNPETFTPGINYILVKVDESEIITDSGIIINSGNSEASKSDVATLIGEVVTVGETTHTAKYVGDINKGDQVLFDAYVGLDLASVDAASDIKYKVMFSDSVLGIIN